VDEGGGRDPDVGGGRCLVFDDSFEHEVGHDGATERVVLILDMAHPDLDQTHRQRLLDNRPGPEERIVAFMREHGLAGVTVQDGEVVFTPDATTGRLVARYLDRATSLRLYSGDAAPQAATRNT
jgi:hypothetical protein